MNMLANQSVYGKNSRISLTFSCRFFIFGIYFDHFEGFFENNLFIFASILDIDDDDVAANNGFYIYIGLHNYS